MEPDLTDRTQEQISRGNQAAQLLAHPMLQAAFEELEAAMFEQLAEVNMHDAATKDELLRSVKNLRRIRGVLENHISTGKYAALWLEKSKVRGFLDKVFGEPA